ncbi:MAG: metallopeptidase family protein [Phycisphaerales bacterium]
MTKAEQDRFDRLLQDAIESLPPAFREALDKIPVIVVDRPGPELVAQLKREGTLGADDTEEDLMGLHSGIAVTEQSVESSATLPPTIHIFREGVLSHACEQEGWASPHADEDVYEEVRITLMHELGHHFGLDEDDLDELGYG